jgi:glycosyltransferase involved in cell wall biosynthesis
MRLSVLVPEIHDRPTGGNIYNRRIVTELRDEHAVEVRSWAPDDGAAPPRPSAPSAVCVVDSLLARHDEALLRLRQAHPGPLVLLAHYLHSVDPQSTDAAAARTERAVLPLFDGIVVPSRYAQRALIEEGLAPDGVGVVPPGLDADYRAPLPDRPPDGPPLILTVASLLPGKGLPALVDRLSALTDRPWRWRLVGDDTLDPAFADTVRARVRASAVADRVTEIGPVPPDAMRAQYDAAALFVLPSRFETCSMATREALARGLPVVAYAVGGLPENLAPPAGADAAGAADAPAPGRLVPLDAPDAFEAAVRTLLAEPDTRRAMGRAAREQSAAFPSWATAAARFASFVRTL